MDPVALWATRVMPEVPPPAVPALAAAKECFVSAINAAHSSGHCLALQRLVMDGDGGEREP